jgi:hypothetical protein
MFLGEHVCKLLVNEKAVPAMMGVYRAQNHHGGVACQSRSAIIVPRVTSSNSGGLADYNDDNWIALPGEDRIGA